MNSRPVTPGEKPSAARRGSFQTTHWSIVLASQTTDLDRAQEALNHLCWAYWKPVYVFLRGWGYPPQDAEDITQEFLAGLLQRGAFATVHPAKGRFRSFLIVSLKNFLSHQRDRANAQKRGGGRIPIPLDEAELEACFQREAFDCDSPDQGYDRRWALTVLEQVRLRLHGEYIAAGKGACFDFLIDFLPGGNAARSQSEIAEALGLTVSAVKSEVYRLRQRFGQFLRGEVASTVADPAQIDDEIRYLIGVFATQ